ncbi:MAG: hypothetical protein JSR21_10660 [Proteobacteria bacterium]|nr:hypothetical protein [Pseudomonadota bacterium]
MTNDNDNDAPDCQPTANGILLCLHMLAEEAMSLNLLRSVEALRMAAKVVAAEVNDLPAGLCSDLRATAASGGRAHH